MTTYDYIASNKRKSILLIVIFTTIVMAIGYFLDRYYEGGGFFLFIAAAYSIVSALVGLYAGDKVALASSGARPVNGTDNPYVYRMIENMCIATGSPMPRVYVIDDPAINAFATGRDPKHASIAVTTGAISKLDQAELEGVLAHELSHVRNYDIRVMTLVIVLVGVLTILADLFIRSSLFGGNRRRDDNEGGHPILMIVGIAAIVLSPIIAQLIQLAVSRRREFLADASGALITRHPEGLARALEKIGRDNRPMQKASSATAHLFIASPFSGKSLAKLFSTHPPIEERIAALRQMGG